MGRKRVEGFLTTSAPIEKYGWIALHPKLLEKMAVSIRDSQFQMRIEHDARQRLVPRLIDVVVRPVGDSEHLGLWVAYDVDAEEWNKAGYRLGFSIAFFADMTQINPESDKPRLFLGVDAGFFPDSIVEDAASRLAPSANLTTARLFLLSEFLPEAKVVVEFLMTTAQGVGVNALYDALKLFLKRVPFRASRSAAMSAGVTVFEFNQKIETEGGKTTITNTGVLRTSDPAALMGAIESWDRMVERGIELAEFNQDQRDWNAISR